MEIDKEFSNLIPPLNLEELKELENSINKEGIREPLYVWNDILIDGHNRFNISKKLNIDFKTKNINFKDRDEAKLWIINNQLARRNISSYDRIKLNLKKESIFKLIAKENIKIATGGKKSLTLPILARSIDVREEIAKLSKVAHGTVSKVQFIEKYSTPEQKERLSNQEDSINKVYHETRRIISQNNFNKEVSMPKDYFSIIYADPPYKFKFSKSIERSIEVNYPTMELEEIKQLKVPSSDNAVLFLWTTAPKLVEGLEIMKAWGFEYKTCAIWDKEIIGMGYWFRGQHEILLLGTKGEVKTPDEKNRVSSIIRIRRKKHSEKPKEIYEIIEKMFPNKKYLELFARNKRKGWTSWGNEIE